MHAISWSVQQQLRNGTPSAKCWHMFCALEINSEEDRRLSDTNVLADRDRFQDLPRKRKGLSHCQPITSVLMVGAILSSNCWRNKATRVTGTHNNTPPARGSSTTGGHSYRATEQVINGHGNDETAPTVVMAPMMEAFSDTPTCWRAKKAENNGEGGGAEEGAAAEGWQESELAKQSG